MPTVQPKNPEREFEILKQIGSGTYGKSGLENVRVRFNWLEPELDVTSVMHVCGLVDVSHSSQQRVCVSHRVQPLQYSVTRELFRDLHVCGAGTWSQLRVPSCDGMCCYVRFILTNQS